MASADDRAAVPVLDEEAGDGGGAGQEDAAVIGGRGELVTGDEAGLDDLLAVGAGPVLAGGQAGAAAEHEGAREGPGLGGDILDIGHAQPGLLPHLSGHGRLNGLAGLDEAGHDRVAPGSPGGAAHEEEAVGGVGDRHDDGRVGAREVDGGAVGAAAGPAGLDDLGASAAARAVGGAGVPGGQGGGRGGQAGVAGRHLGAHGSQGGERIALQQAAQVGVVDGCALGVRAGGGRLGGVGDLEGLGHDDGDPGGAGSCVIGELAAHVEDGQVGATSGSRGSEVADAQVGQTPAAAGAGALPGGGAGAADEAGRGEAVVGQVGVNGGAGQGDAASGVDQQQAGLGVGGEALQQPGLAASLGVAVGGRAGQG